MTARHVSPFLVLFGLLMSSSPAVSGGVVFVDADSGCDATDCGHCGASWAAAFPEIQAAIDCTTGETEIRVAAGIYGPIALRDGVRIVGGFAGGEASLQDSRSRTNPVIIDGAEQARGVLAEHCGPNTEVRGVTVRRGADRLSRTGGGGALIVESDVRFIDVVFEHNFSDIFGGGACVRGGSPQFINCVFRRNGHVYDRDRNLIEGTLGGGALFIRHGSPSFVNCLLHDNHAHEGGAVANFSPTAKFTNCTIANNRATTRKAGAVSDYRGAEITNSIIWGNDAVEGFKSIWCNDELPSRVSYSDVEGGFAGSGNVDADPRFDGSSGTGFGLGDASPCVDAGRDTDVPSDTADLDLDGNKSESVPSLGGGQRREGAAVDLGAIERRSE